MKTLIFIQVVIGVALIVIGTVGIVVGTVPILPIFNLTAGIVLVVGTTVLLIFKNKA